MSVNVDLLNGTKGKVRVHLTFKEEGASQLNYLVAMNLAGGIKILSPSIAELSKVGNSYEWGQLPREVIIQTKGNKFDLEDFRVKFLNHPNVLESAVIMERTAMS